MAYPSPSLAGVKRGLKPPFELHPPCWLRALTYGNGLSPGVSWGRGTGPTLPPPTQLMLWPLPQVPSRKSGKSMVSGYKYLGRHSLNEV